jgi:hypothetical protein
MPVAPNSFDSDAATGTTHEYAQSPPISSLAKETHVEALDRLASQAGMSSFTAGATDESTGGWAHGPDEPVQEQEYDQHAREQLREAKLIGLIVSMSEDGWQHDGGTVFTKIEVGAKKLSNPTSPTVRMMRRTTRHAGNQELIENLEMPRECRDRRIERALRRPTDIVTEVVMAVVDVGDEEETAMQP